MARYTIDATVTRRLLAAAAEIIPTLAKPDLAELLASGADVHHQVNPDDGPAAALYRSACHRLAAVASPRVITGPDDPRIPGRARGPRPHAHAHAHPRVPHGGAHRTRARPSGPARHGTIRTPSDRSVIIMDVHRRHLPGQRVELVHTTDPYTKVQPGAQGTVLNVDDRDTVHIQWDDGAVLGMAADLGDEIRPVPANIVTVWHNSARGFAGRRRAFRSGDRMVKVLAFDLQAPYQSAMVTAVRVHTATLGWPTGHDMHALAAAYRARHLRTLRMGDLVTVGPQAFVIERRLPAPLGPNRFVPDFRNAPGTTPVSALE